MAAASEESRCATERNLIDSGDATTEAMKIFIENGFKTLTDGIKSANRLPFGKARDFYESYPSFHKLMKEEAVKVLEQLSSFMNHAGYKVNIQRRDDDEKFEMIVEANDMILAKVGQMLDEISGVFKYPKAELLPNVSQSISGSWNVFGKSGKFTAAQVLCSLFKQTKNIEKPQLKFKDVIDNDRDTVFVPKIKTKCNMLKPLALTEQLDESGIIQYGHPYQFELEHFKPNQDQLHKVTPIPYKGFSKTPLYLVEKPEQVKSMIADCANYKEIAVDLEHHSYRSFQGFTCLIQISTRDTDYIIDALLLRNELEILNEVFTNSKIVKVFHAANSDLLWLQRDFGVYVVNLFDTFDAAEFLKYPRLSLAFLLQHFCKVNVEKHFQLADWRIRPLPDPLIEYARGDTHYLLFVYDNLKNLLIDKGNGQTNHLECVLYTSTSKCLQTIYRKPVWSDKGHLHLYHKSKKLFDNRQKFALKCLYDWRDKTARSQDESLEYVLPNHMMLQISEALPREAQGILACCSPVPALVQKNLIQLHEIILKAREQPLCEPMFEERQFYRHVDEYVAATDNHLRCPHDLNHDGEFRDDLPVLISGEERETNNKYRDEELLAPGPIVNVFESTVKERSKNVEVKGTTAFLSPYQRYKLTKPFNETKEANAAEAQKIIKSNKEKIEKMEVNVVQSLLKQEPVNEPKATAVANDSLRKKKSAEMKKFEVEKKKLKTEEANLLKNPYYNDKDPNKDTHADKRERENNTQNNEKKAQKIEPFNYSSVDFDRYQTYVKAEEKANDLPGRRKRGIRGRKRK